MSREGRQPVGRGQLRPRGIAGGDKAFELAIRPPRCNPLGAWPRREAFMEVADGLLGGHFIEASDHSRPSGTSSNRRTSTSPWSVIFSSGMTDSARKLTLMKGAAKKTPIP